MTEPIREPEPPLLMLVDGNNICIQAFSALSKAGLKRSSDGMASGGIFGAVRVLTSYVATLRPTHVLFTFDYGLSKFRSELLPEYKGNRKKHSDREVDEGYMALKENFKEFQRFLDLVGIKWYREYGVEADDHMAKAVKLFSRDVPITILSADHDLRQLVSRQPIVTVMKPKMGGQSFSKEKVFTYDRIIEEYEFPPEKLPEVWALQGDSSDNIPGIPGIGPKRATEMLKKHGELAKVLINDPRCEGHERRVQDNLKLIHLDGRHSALDLTLEDVEFDKDKVDLLAVAEFYREWEFSSLLSKLASVGMWA